MCKSEFMAKDSKNKVGQKKIYAYLKATWKIMILRRWPWSFRGLPPILFFGGNFLHLHGMIACNPSQNPICSYIFWLLPPSYPKSS